MEQLEVKKLRFPVIVETDEDGYYIVSCPLFKGCHSYGKNHRGGFGKHKGSYRDLFGGRGTGREPEVRGLQRGGSRVCKSCHR